MVHDDTAGMTEEQVRSVFFYPSGITRMVCPADNDGFPTCLGDNSMCGYSVLLGKQVCKELKGVTP